MEVRLTKPEELDRVRELFALAFRIPMKRDAEQEPDEALHWAAFDGDGQMMSAITVLDQLSETERRLKGLEAEARLLRESRDALLERQGEVERRLAEKVVEVAARIEAAAEKMV